VPDGTAFAPGEPFTKTWRLKNTGTTTWNTDYLLLFIDGALMDAPASVPVPKTVAPDESVDISVGMVAPAEPGSYRGFWKLKSAGGQIFGLGAAGNEAIWVDIVVQGSQAAAGTTPTVAGSGVFTNVLLNVDNASASEPCPHTFRFTAQFTLNKAATVTYSLEVGDNSGAPVKAPPPATQNLQPGTHSVVYELSFPQNLNGWARLHIVEPDEMRSNQINFTLVCV
jgi:hypothetical protein